MASLERKRGKQEPFYMTSGARRPTSAEIVTEARRSLRTLGTQRPFTPREEDRKLFGDASARARDGRPPSTFSLHAQNFEAPDSRPNSGTRLAPLEHKPLLPLSLDEGCSEGERAVPKPPVVSNRSGSGGTRPRRLRAGSLTRLPSKIQPPKMPQTEECDKPSKVSMTLSQQGNRETLQHPEAPPHLLPHAPDKHSGTLQTSREDFPCARDKKTEDEYGNEGTTGSDATDVFWNSEVLPVLQEFEAIVPGQCVLEETLEHLCEACSGLHKALAEKGLLGRRWKKRTSILRALFTLIDLGSDKLNLTLAELIMAFNVSGTNLLNICKLIFKISRSSSNDVLFQNSSMIDSLLSLLQCEDVYSSGEAVLYSVGSLKLLSGNPDLSRLLLAKGLVGLLLQLSQRLLGYSDSKSPHNHALPGASQRAIAGHILVQLTAALRTMADQSEAHSDFLANAVFPILCTVMDHHQDDRDICLNVTRIFSKLSSYAECCRALTKTLLCYRLFLDLLSKHIRKQDLVVRLLFTLGNLASKSSEARERVYDEEGAIDILLGLFQSYKQAAVAPKSPQEPQNAVHQEEDVLVKLIRVLANLSIHPTVGTALAANKLCVQLLLEVMEVTPVEEKTELVLIASAAINNLSYYQDENSAVRAQHTRVSKLLQKLLLSSNMDAVLEATRVFGNLSQIKPVRHFIIKNKVHQFVVTLLDSRNPDVCFSACGVLMNLSADPENRNTLGHEGAIHKLIDCLRDYGPRDWQLAALVCQTLWNCTEEGEQQYTQELLEILTIYSDQEALQWPCSDEIKEYQEACWEMEFLPVARSLKKRLQNQSNLLEKRYKSVTHPDEPSTTS